MELIQWTEKYSVGIKEIDNQHKGLVLIINELFSVMSQGKAKEKITDIFSHLKDYSLKHFSEEEKMLIKCVYKDFIPHKEEHKKFIKKLSDLEKEFKEGKVTISIEILNFLKDWLLNHILISDKKYIPCVSKIDY